MNRLEGKSLDDEIKRYTEQMMNRYAQRVPTSPPPQPAPMPAPAPEPELEDMAEPATPMPEPAPQRPNSDVTSAQRPNSDVTSPAPQRLNSAVTAPPPAQEAYQRYLDENPQRGILRVQTLTARGTYPVPGVKVVISKMFPDGEYVIATQETDNAGKTEGLLLPAPDRSLSEQPGNGVRPFADYKLTVIHPDFATIVAMQLPVFAGESSLQVLNLIPLSAAPHGSSTIEYITTEPSDL